MPRRMGAPSSDIELPNESGKTDVRLKRKSRTEIINESAEKHRKAMFSSGVAKSEVESGSKKKKSLFGDMKHRFKLFKSLAE